MRKNPKEKSTMNKCKTCPTQTHCEKNANECAVESPQANIKKIYAIMSGKGGVGKSTMTCLLAKELAKAGKKVGVLDADLIGPSIPRLFQVQDQVAQQINAKIQVIKKDGIALMSMNFLIKESDPIIWRGPMISKALTQFYQDVDWGDLDVMLIDMPPGTSDVALTILQTIPLQGVIMVTTPQPMVNMIVNKAIQMCKQVKVDIVGVISNMCYVESNDHLTKIDLYDQENPYKELLRQGIPILGQVPFMQAIGAISISKEANENVSNILDEVMQNFLTEVNRP